MSNVHAGSRVSEMPSGIADGVFRFLDAQSLDLAQILARVSIAIVFWRSFLTKVNSDAEGFVGKWLNWEINPTVYFLFEHEYKVPILPHQFAAHMATYAEWLLPMLLVIGLGTRFAAIALLGMTAVIQFFVYPAHYPEHGLWATALVLLILRGPGVISADHFIRKFMQLR